MRLTVASRVSDQPSIGPRGVFDQLWTRMRPAISVFPVIRVFIRVVITGLFMVYGGISSVLSTLTC